MGWALDAGIPTKSMHDMPYGFRLAVVEWCDGYMGAGSGRHAVSVSPLCPFVTIEDNND